MTDAKEWLATLAGNDFDIEKFIRDVQKNAIDTVIVYYEEKISEKIDFLKSINEIKELTHPYDLGRDLVRCVPRQIKKINEEEIIHLFETVGYTFVDEQTSKLTPYKKLVFTQEGFTAEIWSKGQSIEEVVKVIATHEFMRGAEEIKYKNKGES